MTDRLVGTTAICFSCKALYALDERQDTAGPCLDGCYYCDDCVFERRCACYLDSTAPARKLLAEYREAWGSHETQPEQDAFDAGFEDGFTCAVAWQKHNA